MDAGIRTVGEEREAESTSAHAAPWLPRARTLSARDAGGTPRVYVPGGRRAHPPSSPPRQRFLAATWTPGTSYELVGPLPPCGEYSARASLIFAPTPPPPKVPPAALEGSSSALPPFSSARGPDRREAGSGASEERRRSRAVWCWPTAKFLQWKSLGGALVPHTQTRDLSALQKAHYPQWELVRARALPVLNSADATSARSLRLRRLLGGRRLDPRAQAAVPLHRPAVFVTVRRPLGLLRLAFIV